MRALLSLKGRDLHTALRITDLGARENTRLSGRPAVRPCSDATPCGLAGRHYRRGSPWSLNSKAEQRLHTAGVDTGIRESKPLVTRHDLRHGARAEARGVRGVAIGSSKMSRREELSVSAALSLHLRGEWRLLLGGKP